MALQPVEEGTAVELTENEKLMQMKKADLVAMIESKDLKYKKLQTKNGNTNKELKELKATMEEAADTILKLTDGVELANDEAAQLSNSLLVKNRNAKEISETVVDMIHAIDLTLKSSMKILEMNGILTGGNN